MDLIQIAALILLGWNVVTFATYGIDKWKAKHRRWRIPETVLLLMAFLGGAVGALLGMKFFHHKTHHKKFQVFVPVFLMLHLAFVFFVVFSGQLPD